MLSIQSQKNIEKLLISKNIVPRDQLEQFKVQAVQKNEPLMAVIQAAGVVSPEDMVKLTAQASGLPYVNLTGVAVPPEILNKLTKDTASNYQAVVFGRSGGKLAVAMLDPSNLQAIDFLTRKLGEPILAYMASQASIEAILLQYKANLEPDIKEALAKTGQADSKASQVKNFAEDAPISKALNTIMESAVNARASDIHIEPREGDVRIRFRVDGVLQETMKLPKTIEAALVSRIKILTNLKIDEHRIPQDGEFTVRVHDKEIDLRVAISPVAWGEQVVIRLLDKDNTLLTLESLGFKGRAYRTIWEGIHRPHGMTLATGPTGSGKSTSLYAILQAIKSVQVNVVTLEDPIEYKMEGVNQIQVNPEVGLTFANGLRSILRQDPNIIMVGEMRDQETANLAVQAALTGHIVLSTIHTNSSAGVLPRLLDMQVEPFLVASTVNTVIGQRLVRKICDKCRGEYKASESEVQSIHQALAKVLPATQADVAKAKEDLGYDTLPLAGQNAYTLFKGKGCKECSEGYKGRVGIYEVFGMSQAMEKLLSQKTTTSEVQRQAEADGMITMKQDGYLKALNGLTTLEEVARVAADF